MYDATNDPYTYENSTVLVNKLDLRNQDELNAYEAEISNARSGEPLPDGDFDFAHLLRPPSSPLSRCLHLGRQPRTVRMSKQGNPFCYPEHIETEAAKLFARLKEDSFLDDLDSDEFSARATHFLSELNAIHAFREGNGRTQLTFLAMLADNARHPLHLERLDRDPMLDARIRSFEGNENGLVGVIRNLID